MTCITVIGAQWTAPPLWSNHSDTRHETVIQSAMENAPIDSTVVSYRNRGSMTISTYNSQIVFRTYMDLILTTANSKFLKISGASAFTQHTLRFYPAFQNYLTLCLPSFVSRF